jgi:hypothetical protein
MFEWSDRNSANARNAFSYIDYSAGSPVERVVYAMKDREWIFFQSGDPLSITVAFSFYDAPVVRRLDGLGAIGTMR